MQCLIGANFLERMTDAMADGLVGKDIKGAQKIKILGHITDPLTDSIIDVSWFIESYSFFFWTLWILCHFKFAVDY